MKFKKYEEGETTGFDFVKSVSHYLRKIIVKYLKKKLLFDVINITYEKNVNSHLTIY